jgi:hypothetical protein
MRVLIFNRAAVPLGGGMNRLVIDTAKRLRSSGHDVALVHGRDGGQFDGTGYIYDELDRRALPRDRKALVPAAGAVPAPSARFAIRFHLAPGIQASLIQNGAAALLRTASGQAWRLQVAGAALDLAESVSFAQRGSARRAEQLVAAATAGAQGTSIKWAFKRVAAGK